MRSLGLAGVALFAATAFTPLASILDRWAATHPDLKPSDAIVVLGHNVSPSGVLSGESALRLDHAIALYRQGLAPLLVFLGAANQGGPAEAEVRAQLARLLGVPPGAILTEARVHTTREEAVRVKDLLQPKGVRTLLLVTNSAHLLRARPLFERAGFEVHAAPSDTFSDPGAPEERLALLRGVLEELGAWMYYRVAGYL